MYENPNLLGKINIIANLSEFNVLDRVRILFDSSKFLIRIIHTKYNEIHRSMNNYLQLYNLMYSSHMTGPIVDIMHYA